MPQTTLQKIVVYGDFNCPFCYALHEHLQTHNRLELVEWRLIQHTPEVSSHLSTTDDQIELTSEVATVRHRAPDISIALPPSRPNTEQANVIAESLRQIRNDISEQFRKLVYRALWQDGLDISTPKVLQQLLEQAGSHQPEFNPVVKETLSDWQKNWEQGRYDQRIPVMQHPKGEPLIGLASIQDILSYLIKADHQQSHTIASCSFKPRPIILLLGSLTEYWPQIQPLRDDYDIRVIADADQFSAFHDGPEQADLLLLTGVADNEHNMRCLQLIKQHSLQHLSVIMLSQQYCPTEHALSCQLGYSDYLHPDVPVQVSISRIDRLITLKRLTDQLLQQSNRDHLTQLYNRREFEHQLELEWLRASRSKQPLSLLMIDIDLFKQYNDNYGHLVGDDCLRSTASVIEQAIQRPADRAFRYGGEEFILLLPDTDQAGARLIAHKIQHQLSADKKGADADNFSTITLSIGIATSGVITDQTPYQLLTLADQKLLEAKGAGRNRIHAAILA
ncbi:diguanylate cyclase [Amphritea sp. HPY]|uniref:diguanylate cyclase n=1 Tax=Amphritea sp. HPY TaxID=3421652 RepID=UPI003D7C3E2F